MVGPVEGFNPGKFARRLYPTMFGNYAQRFDREGDTRFGSASDQKARRTLAREFTVDDAMLQDFKTFVKSQLRDASQFDETAFNADIEFIRAMLRYEIDINLFDVATARRHLLEKDPQAQYALTLFPEAEKLMRSSAAKTTQARDKDRRSAIVHRPRRWVGVGAPDIDDRRWTIDDQASSLLLVGPSLSLPNIWGLLHWRPFQGHGARFHS